MKTLAVLSRKGGAGKTTVAVNLALAARAMGIKAVLADALGMHLDLFQRIVVSPCSVSAISYAPGQAPAVLTVNSTDQPLAGLRVS